MEIWKNEVKGGNATECFLMLIDDANGGQYHVLVQMIILQLPHVGFLRPISNFHSPKNNILSEMYDMDWDSPRLRIVVGYLVR